MCDCFACQFTKLVNERLPIDGLDKIVGILLDSLTQLTGSIEIPASELPEEVRDALSEAFSDVANKSKH